MECYSTDDNIKNSIKEIKFSMDSLSIYRTMLKDKVLCSFYKLTECLCAEKPDFDKFTITYNEFYYNLLSSNSCSSFRYYIIDKLIYDNNIFIQNLETSCLGNIDISLINASMNDLKKLQYLSEISSSKIKDSARQIFAEANMGNAYIDDLPDWGLEISEESYLVNRNEVLHKFLTSSNWSELVNCLQKFYMKNGTDVFAEYNAFIWEDHELMGIVTYDSITLSDLIGYENERKLVIDNTLFFLKGLPANNILLYGDRGTGKSATVKALLNEYSDMGLRIIELSKSHIQDLPLITRQIKHRKQKFIIFIDDLAFEDSEESYTALKAILEGGLEARPHNIIIYATSNRKHLIKEKFSDRSGILSGNYDDEVRAADTLQEKLSLSDRFGITITFISPDKNKYLEIVDGLARKRGIDIEEEELHREALKWELWYNGRSPRTARQFIDWIEGRLKY